jgi:hypothetical protein
MGDELRESGQPHVNGLEYSEHGGYLYCGTRIAFGDYMVGSAVVPRDIFEARWEALENEPDIMTAPPCPDTRGIVDAALAGKITPSTGSVAVDTVLAERSQEIDRRTSAGLAAAGVTLGGKPKATRKRTEPSE